MTPLPPQELSLLNTFLRLVEFTTPMGYEPTLWSMLPGDPEVDEWGNAHVFILNPDGTNPDTMFSSHLDNCCQTYERTTCYQDEKGTVSTDGRTILGADCKIGVALMIKMIHAQIPGWYVFHWGEEHGMVGSEDLAADHTSWAYVPKRCVAFDRRGYDSVITHQRASRCCSEEFAVALAAQLNRDPLLNFAYKPDPSGMFTDSAAYVGIIPECTNLSVGYFGQHTHGETQNMPFAEDLLTAIMSVDWDALPTVREPASYLVSRVKASKISPAIRDLDLLSDAEWRATSRDTPVFADNTTLVEVRCPCCSFVNNISEDQTHFGTFCCDQCHSILDMFEDPWMPESSKGIIRA